MADQDIFSNLKLRLSWGVAGNSAIDAYAIQEDLKNQYIHLVVVFMGYYPSEIANKDLTWEKTSLESWTGFLNFKKSHIWYN